MIHGSSAQQCFTTVVCTIIGSLVGCGGGTGSLKGNVTFQGKPVVAGTVTVFASDGAVCLGEIQSDGTYEIRTVATGKAKITVYSPDRTKLTGLERLERKAVADASAKTRGADPKASADEASPRVNPPGWLKLPEKYADVASTDIATELSRGINSFNITLK